MPNSACVMWPDAYNVQNIPETTTTTTATTGVNMTTTAAATTVNGNKLKIKCKI
jgi:hypothetical protein